MQHQICSAGHATCFCTRVHCLSSAVRSSTPTSLHLSARGSSDGFGQVFVLSAPEPGQSLVVGKFPEPSNPFVRDLIARLTSTTSTSSRAARSLLLQCSLLSLMHHEQVVCRNLGAVDCSCRGICDIGDIFLLAPGTCVLQCSAYALHTVCAVSTCMICQLQLRYVTPDGVYLLFPMAYNLASFLSPCTEQQNTGA